jgi:hypothetical protein
MWQSEDLTEKLKVAKPVKGFPSFNTTFHKLTTGSILIPEYPPHHPLTTPLQYPNEYYPIYASVI